MGLATSAYSKVEPAKLEQRKIRRQTVLIKRAAVRGRGRQPVEAELVDLSIYGCRLAVNAAFKAHDRLLLSLVDDKPIAATTIWYEDEQMGCRFEEPLDRDLFRTLTLMSI